MIFQRLNQFLLFLKDRQKTSFKPARGLNLPGLIHGINLVLSYTIYRFCPDRFHIYGKKTVTGWDRPGLGPETRWMISRLLQDTIFYKADPLFIPFACIFFLATWYYEKKNQPLGDRPSLWFALKKGSQHKVEKRDRRVQTGPLGTRTKQHNSASSFFLRGS